MIENSRSIVDGDSIIHFGGEYTLRGRSTRYFNHTFSSSFFSINRKTQLFRNVPLERWAMEDNGRFSVTISETTLNNYYAYPEIFAIEDDICS